MPHTLSVVLLVPYAEYLKHQSLVLLPTYRLNYTYLIITVHSTSEYREDITIILFTVKWIGGPCPWVLAIWRVRVNVCFPVYSQYYPSCICEKKNSILTNFIGEQYMRAVSMAFYQESQVSLSLYFHINSNPFPHKHQEGGSQNTFCKKKKFQVQAKSV